MISLYPNKVSALQRPIETRTAKRNVAEAYLGSIFPRSCLALPAAVLGVMLALPTTAHASFVGTSSFTMFCERVGEQRVESHWRNDIVNAHDRGDWPGSWTTGQLRYDVAGDDLFAPPARLQLVAEQGRKPVLEMLPLSGAMTVTVDAGNVVFSTNSANLTLDRHSDGSWRGGWATVKRLGKPGGGQMVTYTALTCRADVGERRGQGRSQ